MKETEDQRKGGTLVKDLTRKVCEVRSEGAGSTDVWKSKGVPRTKEVGTVTTPPTQISMVFIVKYHYTKGRN